MLKSSIDFIMLSRQIMLNFNDFPEIGSLPLRYDTKSSDFKGREDPCFVFVSENRPKMGQIGR